MSSSMSDLIAVISSVQFLLTISLSAVLKLFFTVCVLLKFRLGKPFACHFRCSFKFPISGYAYDLDAR